MRTHAVDDGSGGKLDVLGEQVPLPTAVLLDDVGGYEEARARHGATGVQRETRLVQELRLAQEPHGVARGYPVGVVVLGVSIAGRGLRSVVEGLVHLAEVVHIQHVVGVEHEVRLVTLVGVALANALEAVVERVALANFLVVAAGKDDGACLAGHARGVVRAVVGDDEHVDELGRIVLHLDGVDEVADDGALVASRDDCGELVVLLRRELLGLARQHHEHVVELIRVADREREKHAEVEYVNERDLRKKLVQHLCSFVGPRTLLAAVPSRTRPAGRAPPPWCCSVSSEGCAERRLFAAHAALWL